MMGKLPVVHMAHLIGTFFGMSGLVTEVQGKHIAFVGDHSNRCYPVPFILPPQNAWVWMKAKYLRDTVRFGTFNDNKDNKDKLWLTGASKAELTETPLPRLLALPTIVAEFLRKLGGGMSFTQTAKICVRPHHQWGIAGPARQMATHTGLVPCRSTGGEQRNEHTQPQVSGTRTVPELGIP